MNTSAAVEKMGKIVSEMIDTYEIDVSVLTERQKQIWNYLTKAKELVDSE